jgi:hypothetical protein
MPKRIVGMDLAIGIAATWLLRPVLVVTLLHAMCGWVGPADGFVAGAVLAAPSWHVWTREARVLTLSVPSLAVFAVDVNRPEGCVTVWR